MVEASGILDTGKEMQTTVEQNYEGFVEIRREINSESSG
jgi:hypothetical protein